MIYIVTALYHEAWPFIKHYGLKKSQEFNKTEVFVNDSFGVIITGTGKIQSTIGLTAVLAKTRNAEKIINIGICGAADKSFQIGDLVLVHEIRDYSSKKRYYPDILFDFGIRGAAITTFDRPLVQNELVGIRDRLEIVDMEASGFYEAAIRYVTADRIQVLKVVSDHLEGIRCSPELVSDIFARNMDAIIRVTEHRQVKTAIFSAEETQFLEELAQVLRFTATQFHGFMDMVRSYKIRTGNDLSILKSYLVQEVEHKKQAKEHFESIRSILFA